MSVQAIIDSLSRLEKLHQSLLLLSQNKTDALKQGDITGLQSILVQERKYAQAINQVENNRLEIVSEWVGRQSDTQEEVTVSFLLERITDTGERESLEKRFLRLTEVLVNLKQQEQLNQQLMQQSLQFIQLSMDMLDPSMKNMNYNQPQHRQAPSRARSVFDSKA